MYLLFVMTILGITLGYSSLYANLSIDGTTNISSASWNVYWDNIQFGSNNVTTVTTPATISIGKTEVSFNVDFSKPGDTYEFIVDAVNDGTIDAMISVVSSGVYAVNGTTPKTLPDYLEYEVTYDNGSPIEQYHLLKSGDLQTYKIRVHYKEDITASQLRSTADNYLFANGILTSCVFSNIYLVENMKYVVDDNDRISVDDLDGILDKYIKGLRIDEVPVTFRRDKEKTTSYIKQYVDTLITKEKNRYNEGKI